MALSQTLSTSADGMQAFELAGLRGQGGGISGEGGDDGKVSQRRFACLRIDGEVPTATRRVRSILGITFHSREEKR